MRIMALIHDIWLEHCRDSPHGHPHSFLQYSTVVEAEGGHWWTAIATLVVVNSFL